MTFQHSTSCHSFASGGYDKRCAVCDQGAAHLAYVSSSRRTLCLSKAAYAFAIRPVVAFGPIVGREKKHHRCAGRQPISTLLIQEKYSAC